MKRLKYFMIAFIFMCFVGICNVNAEVARVPGQITTKEDLIYYIYYYGGSAKIVGDKVQLTSSLDLNVVLLFANTEAITLDLNGYHLYFSGSDAIKVLSGSTKNITITDSSKSDNDYIRAQSAIAIYNYGLSVVTVENTKVISNGNDKMTIYGAGGNTTNVVNTEVQSQYKGIVASTSSKINVKNSNVVFGNPNGDCGICVSGSNAVVNVNNSNVTMSDSATSAKAIHVNAATSSVNINGGTFKSSNYAMLVSAGTVVVNGGEFVSTSNSGVKLESGAKATFNTAKIKSSNGTAYWALLMPSTASLSSYVGTDYFVDNSSTALDSEAGVLYTTTKEINFYAKPKTAKLSTTTYVYNGYRKAPSVVVKDANGKTLVKDTDYKLTYQSGRVYVGKYYVQITYINKYASFGTKKLYFVINPKPTSIYKLTAGDNKFTVTINKMKTQTTGYQVMYSTSSKFSSYKTYKIKNTSNKVTLKGLNKKKYYVKVRTYKVVNGVTYYSSWSKVKTVVTK